MSGSLLPDPIMQWFDNLGLPLANGFVYTYAAGTTTFQAVYSDFALTAPLAQGFRLDADGKATVYLGAFNYKFDVQDQFGVSIDGYPRDNVSSGVTVAASAITGIVSVPQGGTGVATLTAHGVLIGEAASAVAATSAGTAGQVLVSNGAAADPTFQTPPWVLLKAATGLDTTAGAKTLDSIALPVLTVLDTIIVEYYVQSLTQATATPGLYHVTDAADILSFSGGNLAANGAFFGRATLRQRPALNTNILARTEGMGVGPAVHNNWTIYVATALWTSGWTLGLRHNGVTAGGTLGWLWSVYKLAGQ
jgi:hypothetical protein